MIHVTSDFVSVIAEIDRIEAMPTPGMMASLDSTFADVFSQTVADVHVITGRLKASATAQSSIHNGEWSGKIEYGQGLGYAVYEFWRGEGHDFMRAAEDSGAEFENAIADGLGG